jgi:hypothetical protein
MKSPRYYEDDKGYCRDRESDSQVVNWELEKLNNLDRIATSLEALTAAHIQHVSGLFTNGLDVNVISGVK